MLWLVSEIPPAGRKQAFEASQPQERWSCQRLATGPRGQGVVWLDDQAGPGAWQPRPQALLTSGEHGEAESQKPSWRGVCQPRRSQRRSRSFHRPHCTGGRHMVLRGLSTGKGPPPMLGQASSPSFHCTHRVPATRAAAVTSFISFLQDLALVGPHAWNAFWHHLHLCFPGSSEIQLGSHFLPRGCGHSIGLWRRQGLPKQGPWDEPYILRLFRLRITHSVSAPFTHPVTRTETRRRGQRRVWAQASHSA